MLAHICGYFAGFLNVTVNILSTARLNIQWEEPQWDVRDITRGVQVNCTDGSQYISELRNISDFQVQLALRGTNLNVPVNCCHMVLTTEGNGPHKCDEYTPQMAKGKLIWTSCTCHCDIVLPVTIHGILT